MRVLFVSDAASIHTRRWAEALRERGDEVHVASFRAADIPGVTVHRLRAAALGRAGYLLCVPALRRLAAALRPDIVHAQYVTSYGFVAALAGLHPLVVTAWGTDVLVSPQRSALSRALARHALAAADAVTTVAAHMNAAAQALGVPAAKLHAMPFGVDTRRFMPPVDGPPPGPPWRIISTRNFHPVYSVHTAIEALRLLRAKAVPAVLDLVGAGPLRPALEAQVVQAGLQGDVVFHGHVDHPRLVALLGAAHAFVSTAVSDGNNVSLNEAMACGCFPLATDIPANAQWIEHRRNGWLFPAGDAQALADGLQLALGDGAWRQTVAHHNREVVVTRADWAASVDRMQALYRQVIARYRQEA